MEPCIDHFTTPVGPFSVAVDDTGAVLATAFGDPALLRRRLAGRLHPSRRRICREVREQILAYFAGHRRDFSLRLAPEGTPFQQRVWAALGEIPWGETRTYGEIATRINHPHAARAVGRANAANPLCLLLPCHRVIGADGSLTGFAFGEALKRRLLAHERTDTVSAPKPEARPGRTSAPRGKRAPQR